MAATVLAFPGKLFNASHRTPLRPSQSAEEAAFNYPRFGLNRASHSSDRPSESVATPPVAVTLPAQVDLAVAQVDREIAHYTARLRLLRLMIQKHGSVSHPA